MKMTYLFPVDEDPYQQELHHLKQLLQNNTVKSLLRIYEENIKVPTCGGSNISNWNFCDRPSEGSTDNWNTFTTVIYNKISMDI